jgi:hypothetical protein
MFSKLSERRNDLQKSLNVKYMFCLSLQNLSETFLFEEEFDKLLS